MEIRAPVALTTNKALVEDLLDDYLPLNEKANEELKDDMQEEVIEEAREGEEDDDGGGYERKKREGKAEVKANKGVKRAKKQKLAGLEEREGGLDTNRGHVTVEAVRRSKRLRERHEVIIFQKEEELAVSRKKAKIKEASGKETAPSVLKRGRARPKKVVAKCNFEPKPKLKLTAKQAHLPEGSQCSLPRLSKQKVVPTITSQSHSSAVLRNGRLKIKVGADIAHFPAQVQRRLLKTIERARLII